MKRLLFLILILFSAVSSNAAIFDGVDLNANKLQVLREISSRGYVFNEELECLEGDCQGTLIRIRFNLEDTSNRNKIGQLIIDIPNGDFDNSEKLFNVVYHRSQATTRLEKDVMMTGEDGKKIILEKVRAYVVDEDGTIMILEKTREGIRLTYCTPYYDKK